MTGAVQGRINIAIDGPAGAGKSTIARKVAEELGYIYIDTGAMYRAVTLMVLRGLVDPADDSAVVRVAEKLDIVLQPGPSKQLVFVDGEDVTEAIRSIEVNRNVSRVASIGGVRSQMVVKQKRMASDKGVVMDGRDIGTAVLPDAELKIYLTASVEERASRRFKEIERTHNEVPFEQLKQEIADRDEADKNREISPLTVAEGAIVIDSTSMSILQVVDRIMSLAQNRIE